MPIPTCIDLKARFGTRYRLRKEADGVTWHDTAPEERHWLWEIPCQHGVVYPWGGETLAAAITNATAANRVAALPCITHGRLRGRDDRCVRGDEKVVRFHVDDAEAILAILKPRRRRVLTPEQKAALVARGAKTRLGTGGKSAATVVRTAINALKTT